MAEEAVRQAIEALCTSFRGRECRITKQSHSRTPRVHWSCTGTFNGVKTPEGAIILDFTIDTENATVVQDKPQDEFAFSEPGEFLALRIIKEQTLSNPKEECCSLTFRYGWSDIIIEWTNSLA